MNEAGGLWNTLGQIINSESADELNEAYDVWAASYDHDVKGLLYVGNDATAKSSIGYIQNETTTLMLDVGAGTGLTAQSFRDAGFNGIIDAIDFNAKMLEVAAQKTGLYRKTICQMVTADEPLNVENVIYDVITIGGSMLDNHLPYNCIENIQNVLKPGGFLILNSRISTKTEAYRNNLKQHLQRLVKDQNITIVKDDVIPYHDVDRPSGIDASEAKTAMLFIVKKR